MRIAAGVLIIIAALFDLLAGFTYGIGGGLLAGGSTVVQDAFTKAAKETKDAAAQKAAQTLATGGQAIGGGLMVFGFFLLAMAGLGIAAAVVLFREKAPTFALVVGVLELIACAIGLVLWMGANILTTLPGIVAGVFVIIAALGYRGKPAASVPM
jgi:hypothetical protein